MANNLTTGAGSLIQENKTPDLKITPESPFDVKKTILDQQKAGEEALKAPKIEGGELITPGFNDQISKQVISEPTPKVEETPKVEPVKTEPIKEAPVLDPQTIKSNELANQASEDALKTQENQKILTTFEAALQTGNKEDIARLATANPDLRDNFNSLVRNQFKTSSDRRYFGKYSSFSNEQLNTAVKNGDIVVGSEQYNSLPEEQRNSFAEFQAQDNAVNALESNTEQFASDTTKILSLDSILNDLKTVFSSNLRTQYEDTMNSSEIIQTAKDLEDKQNEVNSVNDLIDAVEDEVKAQYPHLTGTQQASVIADRQKSLLTKKNTLINEYNSKLGTYQTMKDNAALELDFLKYEDQQNKDLYMTALGLYETRRSEMRADDQAALIEQNKKIAADRTLANQKELAIFNQKLSQENLSGGKYIDNGKGDLIYIKDGKEISVLTGLGTASGTSEDANYTYQIKTNDDGSYTVFGLPKKDGLNVFQETFGLDGESAVNWIENTGTGQITSYGGSHDKFQGLDIDGNLGDPITIPLAGTIIEAQSHPLYGNTAVVKLSDGNTVRYSHLQEGFGFVGDKLGKGSVIGTIGNSGNVLKLDGTRPNATELAQGFGSHLDIVTTGPDGKVRTARQTETYLNNIGVQDQIVKQTEETILANSILSGIGDLGDLTPTQKAKVLPIINAEINKQMTADDDRNAILKSSLFTKELDATAIGKLEDMNTVRFQLANLEANLATQDTGPIQGLISKFNPYDTEAQVALAQLAGLTPKVARGIFGEVGVLTDADIKNYQRALPNLTSTAEKNELVIDFMRQLLGEGYKNALVFQSKAGRNMGRFINDYDALTSSSIKYATTGNEITTSSGFKYNTSSAIQAQDTFFNQ